MKPHDLIAWQETMEYTQEQAAEALGIGLSAYKDWRNGKSRTTGKPVKIELRTALACAALAAGLKPWTAPDQ